MFFLILWAFPEGGRQISIFQEFYRSSFEGMERKKIFFEEKKTAEKEKNFFELRRERGDAWPSSSFSASLFRFFHESSLYLFQDKGILYSMVRLPLLSFEESRILGDEGKERVLRKFVAFLHLSGEGGGRKLENRNLRSHPCREITFNSGKLFF